MGGKKLEPTAIEDSLKTASNWKLDGDRIERNFEFKDFREAMAFLVRIAFEAEETDHHPDILLSYKRLRLRLTTHSEGGLTEKDFAMAKVIDSVHADW